MPVEFTKFHKLLHFSMGLFISIFGFKTARSWKVLEVRPLPVKGSLCTIFRGFSNISVELALRSLVSGYSVFLKFCSEIEVS